MNQHVVSDGRTLVVGTRTLMWLGLPDACSEQARAWQHTAVPSYQSPVAPKRPGNWQQTRTTYPQNQAPSTPRLHTSQTIRQRCLGSNEKLDSANRNCAPRALLGPMRTLTRTCQHVHFETPKILTRTCCQPPSLRHFRVRHSGTLTRQASGKA